LYLSIEQQFRKLSNVLKNQIIFLLFVFLVVIVETLIVCFFFPSLKGCFIVAICGDILFFFCCYLYIVISNWNIIKKNRWKIFDIGYNISEYDRRLQQKDLVILKELLKENKVNTRTEIQELIRHYQCLLPRTIQRSGVTLSIFALVVSIWSLIYKESTDNALHNLFLIIVVSISILIVYGLSLSIYNKWFKIFGNAALYSRLEAALTEIYVNTPIAKRKRNQKKQNS